MCAAAPVKNSGSVGEKSSVRPTSTRMPLQQQFRAPLSVFSEDCVVVGCGRKTAVLAVFSETRIIGNFLLLGSRYL